MYVFDIDTYRIFYELFTKLAYPHQSTQQIIARLLSFENWLSSLYLYIPDVIMFYLLAFNFKRLLVQGQGSLNKFLKENLYCHFHTFVTRETKLPTKLSCVPGIENVQGVWDSDLYLLAPHFNGFDQRKTTMKSRCLYIHFCHNFLTWPILDIGHEEFLVFLFFNMRFQLIWVQLNIQTF